MGQLMSPTSAYIGEPDRELGLRSAIETSERIAMEAHCMAERLLEAIFFSGPRPAVAQRQLEPQSPKLSARLTETNRKIEEAIGLMRSALEELES